MLLFLNVQINNLFNSCWTYTICFSDKNEILYCSKNIRKDERHNHEKKLRIILLCKYQQLEAILKVHIYCK